MDKDLTDNIGIRIFVHANILLFFITAYHIRHEYLQYNS